jgi:PAS domain S-box-containing protein
VVVDGSVGLGIAVGVAYLVAAHLSLTLLTKPDSVAVFWPAAGIASGTLIAFGPNARAPVALGVLIASAAASLLGGYSFPATIVFALCNAGESLVVASLISQRFGKDFGLDSLRKVLGFFAAAAVGPALSGIVATAGFVLFYNSMAPVPTTWLNWFASDALGIVMVAPLLIGLGGLRRDLPERWELTEGALTLAGLGAVSALAFGFAAHYWWYTLLPLGLFLPALLAAHCRPVFAAAAALILGCAVVWTTAYGMGELGDLPSLPDRAYAVRATLLAISIYTLVLAALFAERRNNERALEDGNNRLKGTNRRLQLALDGAELGVWSVDTTTGRFESDARDGQIHGYPPDAPPKTLAAARSFIHPSDLRAVDAAFSAVKRTGNSCKVEYRLASADGTDLRPERWVAAEGTVVRGADGQPDQLLGVTRDTTERKQAEQALAERDALIGLAEKVTRVGNYTVDINTKRVRVSEGCIAIHGFPEGTAEIRRDDWRAGVHPDDLAHFDRQLSQAFTERWPEYKLDYRIIRSSGEIRWIEERAVIAYDGKARPERLVGVNIDVTERKRVEEQQRTLMAELDHRVKNALATVSAVVSHTRQGSKSIADFVAALDGRIRSMARTHELLSSRGWDGVSLSELVRRVLAPYATGNNAEICGPELTLSAEAGQVVSMALHELTTNAAKHGALSVHDGQVSVHWHRASNGNTDAPLAIEWQETGGPAVQTPEACGYGMEVIRDLIPYELGGRVDLAFAADGLRCHLEIPAGWLSNGSRSLGAVS